MSNDARSVKTPVHQISDARLRKVRGEEPPGGDDLEARVIALEKASQEIREKLVRVETKLDHTASKEDLQSVRAQLEGSMRTQLQWFVGLTWTASIALVGVTYFIATHLPK